MKNIINIKVKGVLALLLFSTYALSGCNRGETVIESQEAVRVNIGIVEYTQESSSISFPARVTSQQTANLSTIIMGTITELEVEVGDFVNQGDILARIRDEQIQARKLQLDANMAQAQAHLTNVERNYNRIKNLFRDDSATQKEMDDISAMYDAAKANIEALDAAMKEVNETLTYTIIRAPFNGVITQKFNNTGDLATPGHPILSISDSEKLKIQSSVPERIINKVEEGMSVTVSIPALGADTFYGGLTNLSSVANPANRQFSVEAILDESEQTTGLRAGMYAELLIPTSQEAGIQIPKSALIKRGQLTGVYTVTDDNRLILRWVRTGKHTDDKVEIVSGLDEGERYVTIADPALRQGILVSNQ